MLLFFLIFPQFARQVVDGGKPVGTDGTKVFHGVLKLADIAGPAVEKQFMGDGSQKIIGSHAVIMSVFFVEMTGQQQDIAGALMKRREL